MKLYQVALVALLAIGNASATVPRFTAPHSHATISVAVLVGVTPRQLSPLDTATITATFSSEGPDTGLYTATLELRPRGGSGGPSATQGAVRLSQGQRLTVYWEWRADASLPPGLYTVRVRLTDLAGATVASGAAPAPLTIAGPS